MCIFCVLSFLCPQTVQDDLYNHFGELLTSYLKKQQLNSLFQGRYLLFMTCLLLLRTLWCLCSGPGSCHLVPKLLQLAPGWSAFMCRTSSIGLEPTQVSPHYTAPSQPALAASCCLNLIHNAGTCLSWAQAHPSSITWTNHTVQQFTMLLYCQSVIAQQNHKCLMCCSIMMV